MVAADQHLIVGQLTGRSVPERRLRANGLTTCFQDVEICVERDLAEGDDDTYRRQRGGLGREMGKAARDLFGRRLVLWRRAAHSHGDEGVAKHQTVVGSLTG